MRVTVAARVSPELESRLRARTERQKLNIRAVNLNAAPEFVQRVQSVTPRDTGYMADHTDFAITNDGFGFEVGWWASAFIGQVNPVTSRSIVAFYPKPVVFGTRFMAGRDPLTPTLEAGWPELRSRYAKALSN